MKRIGLGVLAACVVSASGAFAHHSFSAFYFEERSVAVEGAVEEFQYRNPHAWVRLRVAESAGPVIYAAEWAGAGRLGRQGITAETLKPGDLVKITGSPGRNPAEYRIHLKRIERPADGWTWGNDRGGAGGRRRR